MISLEIRKQKQPHMFDHGEVCTYVRTHGLGLGMSLSLSLIWSPSLANSNCRELTYLSQKFVKILCHFRLFFLAFSYDLDITLQLKRSDWMKGAKIVGTLFTF